MNTIKKTAEKARQAADAAVKACVKRQNEGLPRCGRCYVCADDFFFEQICDEVEGTYQDRLKN